MNSQLTMKKFIAVVFLISLILGLIFAIPVLLNPEGAYQPDSYGYESLAFSLLNTQEFPSLGRTPVYPFFICMTYAVFGHKPRAIVCVQVILSALAVIFVCLIGKIIWNLRIGMIGGLVYAINPLRLYYSTQILTESFFTLLILIGVYYFLLTIKQKRPISIILSGLFFALAVLCRPIGILLPIILAVLIIFFLKVSLRIRLFYSITFLLVYICLLVPWAVRNYLAYNVFTVSSVSYFMFLTSDGTAVIAERDQLSIDESIQKLEKEIKRERLKNNSSLRQEDVESIYSDKNFRYSAEFRKLAIKIGARIIKENPLLILKIHLTGMIKTLAHPPLGIFELQRYLYGADYRGVIDKMDKEVRDRLISEARIKELFKIIRQRFGGVPLSVKFIWILLVLFMVFQYVALFLSLIFFIKEPGTRKYLILLLIIIAYFVFLPGFIGSSRFRVPVEPYLSILSGIGLGVVLKKHKKAEAV